MLTKTIAYIRQFLTRRLSAGNNIGATCDQWLDSIEVAPISKLMAAPTELDNLIAILPLPHAMRLIGILERRTPALLDHMMVTTDARRREASAFLKLMETFKQSHLEMIRAALESAQKD